MISNRMGDYITETMLYNLYPLSLSLTSMVSRLDVAPLSVINALRDSSINGVSFYTLLICEHTPHH